MFLEISAPVAKPQAEPHNWCDKVLLNDPIDCRLVTHDGANLVPSFRTNQIKVFSEALDSKVASRHEAFSDVLVVILDGSKLDVSFDRHSDNLDSGQVLWIPHHADHEMRKLVFKNPRKGSSRYLLIFFDESGEARKS